MRLWPVQLLITICDFILFVVQWVRDACWHYEAKIHLRNTNTRRVGRF